MSAIAEQMEAQLLSRRLSRRAAMGAMALGAALAGTGRPSLGRSLPPPRVTRKARNLIFMVSDGMSAGTLTLADLYLQKMEGRRSNWLRLASDPAFRRSLQTTYSADGPVTDSAAAAAAWGSGFKHTNGAINITPDGRQHVPLCIHAAQNGKKTGLVTTTRITHATPAGFSANVPLRDMEKEIAAQQLSRGIDVLLGGGTKYVTDELLDQVRGAAVVKDAAGLGAVDTSAVNRLIGVFSRHHLPFVTDRDASIPSLPVMTERALEVLSRSADGFVLQIEGGRVDHAAHSSDAYALIREQVEFDETIGVVEKFIAGRDDTLLVITTDHANANPGITLYGARGQVAFDRLAAPATPRKSFEWVYDQMSLRNLADEKVKAAPGLVEEALGVKLGETEIGILTSSLRGKRAVPFAAANVWTFVLGSILADHFGVGFVSPNHTSDAVELLATGPGSEAIGPVVDNTELHGIVTAALGLAPARRLPGMEELVPLVKPKTED
jgi:alkaline phosphatase